MKTPPLRPTAAFYSDDRGSVSGWSMIWSFIFLMFGGLSVDATNAWRISAQLQATADASALAGALKLAEGDASESDVRNAAIDIANINMPTAHHGTVLADSNVLIGFWDATTKQFTVGMEDANAVRVKTRRGGDGSKSVKTFLLRLAGFTQWDIGGAATSVIRFTKNNDCLGASFISESNLQLGGGNTISGSVCFHGEYSVANGGGDLLKEGVKMSSNERVTINSLREGSADPEDIEVYQSMPTVVLPQVGSIYDNLVAELAGKLVYSGDLLPDFIFNQLGIAAVSHHNRYVTFGDNPWEVPLIENTIYVINGGVGINGPVNMKNVAIIASGDINVGGSGGVGPHFENVYWISKGQIGSSGSATWGNEDEYCDTGEYNTYLLSTQALSLGGATSAHGVLGAAPRFSPGGSLKSGGGLYFESSGYTTLGGDMNISSCDEALESSFGTGGKSGTSIAKSALVY